METTHNGITFHRTNNDVNGNPRYIIHYLDLLSDSERNMEGDYLREVQPRQIEIARNRAKELGGKKYRGKDFGGGFVFQSYNIRRLSEQINELTQNKILIK